MVFLGSGAQRKFFRGKPDPNMQFSCIAQKSMHYSGVNNGPREGRLFNCGGHKMKWYYWVLTCWIGLNMLVILWFWVLGLLDGGERSTYGNRP